MNDDYWLTETISVSMRVDDVVHRSEMLEGGRFAAAEMPDLFVGDLRAFGREPRSWSGIESRADPSNRDATQK